MESRQTSIRSMLSVGEKKRESLLTKFKSILKEEIEEYDLYEGPELSANICRFKACIARVNKVVLGEKHLLVHCFNLEKNSDEVYGVGDNIWGQLGFDPVKTDFVTELKPLSIKSLDDDASVKEYTIR